MEPDASDNYTPVLFKQRWLMLALFCSVSMLNAYQWIHLNIIQDNVIKFWKGSLSDDISQQNLSIAWLSMIYMLVYIPFLIPATWLLERYGLRTTLMLAAGFNFLGAWLKCLAVELSQPVGDTSIGAISAFVVLFLAQTICATSQVFILSLPAHLSGVWFGESELSLSTAIGVFGNQFGVALGFALPPLIVVTPAAELSSKESFELLRYGFRILCYVSAAIITLDLVLVLLLFKREPHSAPSRAQNLKKIKEPTVDEGERKSVNLLEGNGNLSSSGMDKVENLEATSYRDSLKSLFTNKSHNLLILCYGVNTGVYYAIGTLLSVILGEYYQNDDASIGWIGFTMVIAGLFGAVAAGFVLQKSQKFRLTVVTYYMLSTVSFGIYIGTIYSKYITAQFISMFILGFFQSGYLPIGFQYAAEITYPINEGLSSGILNMSSQAFGIFLTLISTILQTKFGGLGANLFMAACLVFFIPANFFLKENLNRQKALQIDDEVIFEDETRNTTFF